MIQKIKSVENLVLLKLLAQVWELIFLGQIWVWAHFFSFSFLCALLLQDWHWAEIAADSFLKSEVDIWWLLSNHPLELKWSLNSGSSAVFVKEVNVLAIMDMNC